MLQIILPFAIALAVIGLIKFFWPVLKKERVGEDEVSMVLDMLPKERYFVITDIEYETETKIYQYDHLVVSKKGIFAIQTENYRGVIYGKEYGEKWKKVMYKGSMLINNPILINKEADEALAAKIGVPYEKFIPISVFRWDSSVRVRTRDHHLIYINKLLKVMGTYTENVLTEEEVQAAFDKLKPLEKKKKKLKKDRGR